MKRRLAGLGLRQRLMAVGLTGVVGALVVGGLLLYAAMTTSLNRGVTLQARTTAVAVASLVDEGRLSDPIPVSSALVVQVIDDRQRVTAASSSADRLTPLVSPAEGRRLLAGGALTVPANRAALAGRLTVVGQAAGPAGARVLVVAAVPTADLDESRAQLRRLLLVFFPVVALVLALVAWRVIGAALAPVERLRETAERIGATSPDDERLPVPPTNDEISALATTLNGMLDRLAALRQNQRAFVADAAHELRSPLAAMRTQMEVAQRLGEGDRLPAEMLPEVKRLGSLVEDLLVLARSQDGAYAQAPEPVDVTSLAGSVVSRYESARVPVLLNGAGQGQSTLVLAVPADLRRAVSNLVDNAVRHARTRVLVEEVPRDGYVELTVTDDGSGIPAADLERVFDRFTRLDDARARDTGGSGLGLAITRETLQRSGATVTLEDAEPGVRAVVRLPSPR